MGMKLPASLALLLISICAQGAPDAPLIAHEWGTFTSVQGADGAQLLWSPTVGTDLPRFVHSCDVDNGGFKSITLLPTNGGKGALQGFVRMETPVIYFYSDAERVVDVKVQFPNGRITEWYPQATLVGPYFKTAERNDAGSPISVMHNLPVIEWRGLRVLPRHTPEMSASALIRESGSERANHYYAARKTDANFLAARDVNANPEYESLLFYRGVGTFRAPLTVRLDQGESTMTVSADTTQPIASGFVLTVRGDTMRYLPLDRVAAHGESSVRLDAQPFEPAITVRDRLMHDVATALESQGLFAKEARAMVETWKDQWFAEEGTRVLYLLPRSWTDQALPIDVSPQPDSLVRVMVGRAELITPSVERALTKRIDEFSTADGAAQERVVADTRDLRLGRFLVPATQMVLAKNQSKRFSQGAQALIPRASQP